MRSFSGWPVKSAGTFGMVEGFRQRLRWGWVAEDIGDGSGSPELLAIF